MTTRRWPGSTRANVDHLAVGPGGVAVIDSKHGRTGVVRPGGAGGDAHPRGCAADRALDGAPPPHPGAAGAAHPSPGRPGSATPPVPARLSSCCTGRPGRPPSAPAASSSPASSAPSPRHGRAVPGRGRPAGPLPVRVHARRRQHLRHRPRRRPPHELPQHPVPSSRRRRPSSPTVSSPTSTPAPNRPTAGGGPARRVARRARGRDHAPRPRPPPRPGDAQARRRRPVLGRHGRAAPRRGRGPREGSPFRPRLGRAGLGSDRRPEASPAAQ